MSIFSIFNSKKEEARKKVKVTIREPTYDKSGFEFVGQADENNSLDEIINELKEYIGRYKRDKNIHYHLYPWPRRVT
jgi:hypothetical protein